MNTSAATPAYQQVKSHVLAQIHAGVWKEGDAIPGEEALARSFATRLAGGPAEIVSAANLDLSRENVETLFVTLLLGVLGGGIGHLWLAPGGADAPLLVGLSGGCLGLLLLLVTLSPQSRMMPLPLSGRSLGLGVLSAELFLTLLNPSLGLPGLAGLGRSLVAHGMGGLFEMGHACHFGGGVAGWLFGRWLLRPRVSLTSLRRARERREAMDVRRGR
jgi:membrane associated rhomboid family serine protease